jgi:hypothetical protein
MAGLPTPRHYRIERPADVAAAAAHVGFPAVIKPVNGAASIGVIRVNSEEELRAAYERWGVGWVGGWGWPLDGLGSPGLVGGWVVGPGWWEDGRWVWVAVMAPPPLCKEARRMCSSIGVPGAPGPMFSGEIGWLYSSVRGCRSWVDSAWPQVTRWWCHKLSMPQAQCPQAGKGCVQAFGSSCNDWLIVVAKGGPVAVCALLQGDNIVCRVMIALHQ